MKRSFSSLGITALGLTLAVGGAYAMWTGWDMILLERGWSLFIAGSVALSGGVVTIALGRVIAHLARIGSAAVVAMDSSQEGARPAPVSAVPQEGSKPLPEKTDSVRPVSESALIGDQGFEKPDFSAIFGGAPLAEQPSEVDRYTAGDATYIMMSDGSVEVRSAAGAQRYASLAALRADAESRQR